MTDYSREPWRDAMERAYAASAAYRAEAERAAGTIYRFEVAFTLPSSIARDAEICSYAEADGLRIELTFRGTEEARRRITDIIAELPTSCRTFRRYTDSPEEVRG